MRALTSSGVCCALILIFAASRASTVSDSTQAQCTNVAFPDLMDIHKCINGTMTLCGTSRADVRSSSRMLARCLVKSLATANFFKIALRGLVQAMIYGMQISLPGSSVLAFPFLKPLRHTFRGLRAENKIIFTSRPCNETVTVSFPDFLRIGECVRPELIMCTRTGWMNLRIQVLTAFLSMIVCVMKKIPYFNLLFLMNDMVCSGLTLLVEWLKRRTTFPLALPITQFVEVILGCNAEIGLTQNMERSLFASGFNPQ